MKRHPASVLARRYSSADIEQLRQMTKAARLHLIHGARQTEIAEKMGISQAGVSRLLRMAEEQGIIRSIVVPPEGLYPDLEEGLVQAYGLDAAYVVDVDPAEEGISQILGAAGRIAAGRWSDVVGSRLRPIRIIATELRMLQTTLVAVPALSRVDPAISSGPTSSRTTASGRIPPFSGRQAECAVTSTVLAPVCLAWRKAPQTNGVRPLAVSPTTTSLRPTRRSCTARPPASASSSAPSWARKIASGPPAKIACTSSGSA